MHVPNMSSMMMMMSIVLLIIAISLTVGHAVPGNTSGDCNVRDYGAKGDGVTYDTDAIRDCIRDCHRRYPKLANVIVSDGVFLTGALNLTSYMTLIVRSATILGSTRESDYPIVPALPSYGRCRDSGYPSDHAYGRHQALISGWDTEHTSLHGENGTIDGSGAVWWARHANSTLQFGRPRLIEPMYCTAFTLFGLHLKDSAFWTTHPYACDGVYFGELNITATGPNTDGIDPDSTKNMLVERCTVNVGDDAVAIKSGMDYAGRQFNRSSEHIMIRDSHFIGRRVSIGSEMSGGVRNVTVRDCVLGGASQPSAAYPGLYIKSERGRGGVVEDIYYRNITADVLALPIFISMYYNKHIKPTNKTATPQFRNIYVFDMMVNAAVGPGTLEGLPEQPIDGVVFDNVNITTPNPWICEYTHGKGIGYVAPPVGKCFE